jgi:predicted enzyme related to lactoylglutathione lyase
MLKVTQSMATIPAQDIKRARQFYEQKLGLTPGEEQQDGSVEYRTGDTTFLVFPSTGKASGDHTQLGLDVDDIKSAADELKRKGIKLEEYDYPDFKTEDGIVDLPDGSRGAWFKDPEGNLIALAQRAPAAIRAR